jgi:hypothetical protein
MCPILKKLSNTQLQPFREAHRLITEIMESNKGKEVRILEHLLSFAEFQFGKEVTGISYRERGNGECISNWNVDMLILYSINGRLIDLYANTAFNMIIRDKIYHQINIIFYCIYCILIYALAPERKNFYHLIFVFNIIFVVSFYSREKKDIFFRGSHKFQDDN